MLNIAVMSSAQEETMKKKFHAFCSSILLLLMASDLYAVDVDSLLAEGPVLTVKQSKEGKFLYASALLQINAPQDLVWSVILDLDHYCDFMPRVVYSKILAKSEDGRDITVKFEISVPLVNQRYTLKYSTDPEKKIIHIAQVSGDLRGSYWEWRLTPSAKGTFVRYSGATKNYSALLQKFEDDQQTITVGVNVSSVMTVTRTIKKRAEKLYTEKKQ